MCGIAGKVTTGAPVDPELIRRMCECVRHRGPDGEGIHLDGPVAVGMRRLAIVDVAGGDQPLYNEDRSVIVVCNGEIYNHEELRRELRGRGHSFRTGSDIEVIAHLWEESRERCVSRLRGMFAIALWDANTHTLMLARDRAGKKPVWYSRSQSALVFGSEPRVVLQDDAVSRSVDPRAVDAYLASGYVPRDLPIMPAVRRLPPASTLVWQRDREPVVSRYWRLEYRPKLRLGREEAEEAIRETLLEATRVRLMGEVPIGAFLSGGVDSSAVVAAMAMSSAEPVRTFSVAFPGTPVDETPYARAVAERYATRHEELEVGSPEPSILPRLVWHFGEPFADPAALPTYQLSERIRERVTVALNGDGGDESFAGYRRYWQLAATRPVDLLPDRGRRRLAPPAGIDVHGVGWRARGARLVRRLSLSPPHRYADLMRFVPAAERARLYTPELHERLAGVDPLAHVVRAWDARDGLGVIDRLMAVDLDTYLADDLLPKVDITSMAHSIEVRSPLLDTALMELAARLPERFKARGATSKIALREAVRPWLPDALLDRRKQGFEVPVAEWLRGDMRTLCEDILLDGPARDRGWFRQAEIRRLLGEHRSGRDHGYTLWALLNLELWHRTVIDATYVRAADLPTLA